MELLSVEYGDFADLFDGELPRGVRGACLRVRLSIDPALVNGVQASNKVVDALSSVFPGVQGLVPFASNPDRGLETIARLTAGVILDLQRDLCEWPAGGCCNLHFLGADHEYELYLESIDERVGRFCVQLAVDVVRMMLRQERFDPRLIWVIDLVRHLRRQPRLKLNAKRVAHLLGCSSSSANWAIQELERYGYILTAKTHRPRRFRGGRILIVDDSAQIRDLLSRMLEILGYDVITAVDGEEGLILLDWANYKAVFVDLMMPALDGVTFLQCARAQGVTSPIVVVSAYEHRWSEDEMRSFGATAYLPKPFSITEIEMLLNKHLK